MSRPAHHGPSGRFRNPWPEAAGDDELRKRFREVAWAWVTRPMPPNPDPGALPLGQSEVARPTCDEGQARITWIGHATFLVQLPGLNLLTDPVWSTSVSPVPGLGTRRFVPPALALDLLPPIHAVLLSHDHFDHLDRPTVRALHRRFGSGLTWYTPPGYRRWFRLLGVRRVVELDWWARAELPAPGYELAAAPARHWTRRSPWGTNRRLWCSWAMLPTEAAGPSVYFGGDSGYASLFEEIGDRLGPFDASILPIGAYEPRWFMKASHMNPEEAVQAYRDLGGAGAFLAGHWGTFRLTFEPPLEPPGRARDAWREAALDESDLRLLRHGETAVIVTDARRRRAPARPRRHTPPP